jgi:hypothetical protein
MVFPIWVAIWGSPASSLLDTYWNRGGGSGSIELPCTFVQVAHCTKSPIQDRKYYILHLFMSQSQRSSSIINRKFYICKWRLQDKWEQNLFINLIYDFWFLPHFSPVDLTIWWHSLLLFSLVALFFCCDGQTQHILIHCRFNSITIYISF